MSAQQQSFEFSTWGGARAGAGRKPSGSRGRVPHVARPERKARNPVHVTLRLCEAAESLRSRRPFHVVRDALIAACTRFGTQIVHFSVQSNHVHLICEVEDAPSLSRAMKGLGVRIARGLNRLWRRTGSLIADRYHARELKTPREVRNAIHYLLHNARHHGYSFRGPDPCSSGIWFDGWGPDAFEAAKSSVGPLPRARAWLLGIGWRRHGPIAVTPSRAW